MPQYIRQCYQNRAKNSQKFDEIGIETIDSLGKK
jgi:hypothetical protein